MNSLFCACLYFLSNFEIRRNSPEIRNLPHVTSRLIFKLDRDGGRDVLFCFCLFLLFVSLFVFVLFCFLFLCFICLFLLFKIKVIGNILSTIYREKKEKNME